MQARVGETAQCLAHRPRVPEFHIKPLDGHGELMESLVQPLRAYEHWLAQYKRVWRGTIGTSLLNPLLYLAALGVGLGTIVDRSQNAPAGVPYLDFIAPGLLAAAAMQTAAVEASWPVMGAIKWTRTYYAMTATPLTERDVLIGHQLFVITRVLTASAAYLLVVAAFGAVNSWLGLLAVPVAVLIGTAFSMPMAAYAATREGDSSFPPIFRFLIVPMFLFSGTFFPVAQMPLAFELAAYVTPIWHGVELCRQLTLGEAEVPAALGHLVYLLAWTVGGFLAARRAYRRRLFR